MTYTLAWLVNHLRVQGLELDLNLVWQRQELPDEVGDALRQLAPQVAATIKEAPPQMKARFKQVDKNLDGQLDESEVDAFIAGIEKQRGGWESTNGIEGTPQKS